MKDRYNKFFVIIFILIFILLIFGCIMPNLDTNSNSGSIGGSCGTNDSQVSIQIDGTTIIYYNEFDMICTPCMWASLGTDIQVHHAHASLFPDNGGMFLFVGVASSTPGFYEIGDAQVSYIDHITDKDYLSFPGSGTVYIHNTSGGYIFGTYTGLLRHGISVPSYEYIDVNIAFNVKIIHYY